MSSIEALKELKENAQEVCEWELERLKIIEKDLEILEILKKHLYVHQTNAKDLFELRAIFDLETYDEEEFNKIKDWILK